MKYKTKIKFRHMEQLINVIELALLKNADKELDLYDKLLLANLAELQMQLRRRQLEIRKDYKITMPPSQAIALAKLHELYQSFDTDFGNFLHTNYIAINQSFTH